MRSYAIYTRVSTQRQGASGLGLEAQMKICTDYIRNVGGELTKDFKDIESGTHRERVGLWKAIRHCKESGDTLVIAKLDRLARDVEFIFKVVNSGIDIHFCDMPQVNTMILGIFASVAQYERELISKRTKEALRMKKEKGFRLGNAKGTDMERANANSAKVRREKAQNNQSNKIAWQIIKRETNHEPPTSDECRKIAEVLNDMDVSTSRGLPYNEGRVRNAYYNLKRIYESNQQ